MLKITVFHKSLFKSLTGMPDIVNQRLSEKGVGASDVVSMNWMDDYLAVWYRDPDKEESGANDNILQQIKDEFRAFRAFVGCWCR